MGVREFTLEIRDELAEVVDAFERGDDVVARQLVFKLRDRLERVVEETGWGVGRGAGVS